jgi:hypothetical protein
MEAGSQSIGREALIGNLATAFGVDEQKAGAAVDALSDAVKVRIERSMLSRGGVADVVSLVTAPSAGRVLADARSDPSALASPAVAAAGNGILDVLIGNKHVSRGIAARAAKSAGLDAATAEKMLPVVASLVVGRLQQQSAPALAKLVSEVPGLVGAGGSPLPMPGDRIPPIGPDRGPDRESDDTAPPSMPSSAPSSRPPAGSGGTIDGGSPLPIPGDHIPGVGRGGRAERYPTPDPNDDQGPGSDDGDQGNPYQRLPDIVRRGGPQVPGGGGSLEDVIRSIIGSLLGSNRGVIGTMIQLFLIRWIASFIRGILSRTLGGR